MSLKESAQVQMKVSERFFGIRFEVMDAPKGDFNQTSTDNAVELPAK